jgi:hypothetical protein
VVSITWNTAYKIYLDKLTDFPKELPRIILKKKKWLNPVFLCIQEKTGYTFISLKKQVIQPLFPT